MQKLFESLLGYESVNKVLKLALFRKRETWSVFLFFYNKHY